MKNESEVARMEALKAARKQLASSLHLADSLGENLLAAHISLALDTVVGLVEPAVA